MVSYTAAFVHTLFEVSLVGVAILLAIWVGLSRRHRLLRLSDFCVLPILMYFAGALQLLIWLTLVMGPISAGLLLYRHVSAAPHGRTVLSIPKLRFGFRDMFFAIFLVAISLAAIQVVRKQDSLSEARPNRLFGQIPNGSVVEALACILLGLAAAFLVFGRQRLHVRIAAMAASCALAAVAYWLPIYWYWQEDPWDWGWFANTLAYHGTHLLHWFRSAVPCLIAALVTGVLVAWRGYFGLMDRTRRRSRLRAVLLGVLLLLTVVPVSYLTHELARPLPIPKGELPEPNGWDRLARVAKELRELEQSAPTLRLQSRLVNEARSALTLPSRVRVGYGQGKYDYEALQSWRPLMRAVQAEASLALSFGKPHEALALYLDLLEMSDRIRRGGVVLDVAVGFAAEWAAVDAFLSLVPQLSDAQCRDLLHRLIVYDQEREPIEEVLRRQRTFSRLQFGWMSRWYRAVEDLAQLDPATESLALVTRPRGAQFNVHLCDLAIHCFQSENGSLPDSLADLAPRYLNAVPLDPFDGRPIKYRKTEEEYVLYSVGHNHTDDSGRAHQATGDWPVVTRPVGAGSKSSQE